MPRPQTKLPRKTALDRLNDLIDWYERFKPGGGPKEIPVTFDGDALEKFAKYENDQWHYRGRILRQVEP